MQIAAINVHSSESGTAEQDKMHMIVSLQRSKLIKGRGEKNKTENFNDL